MGTTDIQMNILLGDTLVYMIILDILIHPITYIIIDTIMVDIIEMVTTITEVTNIDMVAITTVGIDIIIDVIERMFVYLEEMIIVVMLIVEIIMIKIKDQKKIVGLNVIEIEMFIS
jgi:hypothetical protein